MASVFEKRGVWYLRVKDEHGVWIKVRSDAKKKTRAKFLAQQLSDQYESLRCGDKVAVLEKPDETVGDLLSWWLLKISKGTPSHDWAEQMITKHLLSAKLATLPVLALKAAHVEELLAEKAQEGLQPQTLNHLRAFVSRVYSSAKKVRASWGAVENPAERVERRDVPEGEALFLAAEEVPRLLAMLDARWQPLFATAIYTGMRKGELLALQKSDVDLERRQIMVSKSHARKTTKGKKALPIPINVELIPFLEVAIAASPSEYVFPAEDGSRMAPDVKLQKVLRRAMGRAGIVTSYLHRCRHCEHEQKASDNGRRTCPTHSTKRMRVKPLVRPLKFHSLRHTFGSNAMMQGVAPFAAQRLLRHSDPSITTEIYGHHVPGFLHSEIDRLSFLPRTPAPAAEQVVEAAATAVNGDPFVPPLSPALENRPGEGQAVGLSAEKSPRNLHRSEGPKWSGRLDLNQRPLAPQAHIGSVQTSLRSPTVQNARGAATRVAPLPIQPFQILPAETRNFVPRLSPDLKVLPGPGDGCLTVAQVAEQLGVSTATVYALIERGDLPHVRVTKGAIRVAASDLAAFIAARRGR